MNLEETDQAAQAVAKAPRISLADIEAAILFEYSFNAREVVETLVERRPLPGGHALGLLSICILVTKNGFTVIGKSAPASPENFNKALGEKLAREDAIRQLWPLMGYALKDRMYHGG